MNPLRGIRAVTFDAGGTLIQPAPSVGDVYAAVALCHGIRADPQVLNHQFARAWKARAGFDYSRAHWFTLMERAFTGIAPVTRALFDSIYDHFALPKPWFVFEDVLPALESLKQRGLKLAVISNWDERLRPLLRDLELSPFFQELIISSEIGAHKPDPRIFEAALRQLGVTAGEALHIGDSSQEDFEGARTAGMHALLIHRDPNPAEPAISHLTQIPTLLNPQEKP